MDWQTFRVDMVLPYGEQTGVFAYDISNTPAVNSAIERGLKDFTRFTYCLFEPNYTLQLQQGVAEYDAGLVFEPINVVVDDSLIYREDGRPGVEGVGILQTVRWGKWYDHAQAKPYRVVRLPGNKLLFLPIPDSDYTAHIIGWREHSDYTAESQEIEVEDNWLDAAAMWCASKLSYPAMTGQAIFEQILARDQRAGQSIMEYRRFNQKRTISHIESSPRTVRIQWRSRW